jgi:hypothetical protein
MTVTEIRLFVWAKLGAVAVEILLRFVGRRDERRRENCARSGAHAPDLRSHLDALAPRVKFLAAEQRPVSRA